MPEENKDATGITTVANSYEEAAKAAAGRRAIHAPGIPMPDTPTGVPHLNTALNPAPPKQVIPERIPVPVINDPGLVGAQPDLGALNAAYRDADAVIAEKKMVPIEEHNEAIRQAALMRQDTIAKMVEEETAKQVDASQSKPVDAAERTPGSGPEPSGDGGFGKAGDGKSKSKN